MDVYAFGPTTTDAHVQSVDVLDGGQSIGTMSFDGTPSFVGSVSGALVHESSGLTFTGQAFNQYSLQLDLPHTADSLDLSFVPSGFRGLFGTSLGFDNINLQLDVPDAQEFAADPPVTVPGPSLLIAEGAGVLEEPAAQDEYSFELTSPTELAIEHGTCVPGSRFTLVNVGTSDATRFPTCRDHIVGSVPAGEYRLDVTAATPGTYSFDLYEVPAAQVFAYTLDSVVSNGVPTAGAGNIERLGSEDRYTFSVPSGGMKFQYDQLAGNATLHVINAETGAEVLASWSDTQVTLPEGDYYLGFGRDARTYSYNMYEVPAPQVFAYTLDSVVSNGVPTAGAGNIERLGAADRYTFSVPSGGTKFQYDQLAGNSTLHVYNAATDAQVFASWFDSQFTLPEGDYYLQFGPDAGTYSFNMYEVPAPQVFPYTLDTVVTDGVPAVGAGNIERFGATDRYTFSVPSGGQALQYDQLAGAQTLHVYNAATDAEVHASWFDSQFSLPEGNYYVQFGPDAGTYSFKIYLVPGPQVFAYTMDTVISDGVPAAGAGNIEVLGASDRYTFTVPAGGRSYQYDQVAGNATLHVINAATGAEALASWSDTQFTLPKGNYYLDFGSDPRTYSFTMYEVPAPQVFAYTLDTVVSDGVPAAGAGNIERLGSADHYTFAVPAGGRSFQYDQVAGNATLHVINAATGAEALASWSDTQFTLPAGNYYLDFGSESRTYSFTMYEVPAPQTFAYTLDTAVSNGAPWAGAGNVERLGSEDRYTFAVPSGGMNFQYDLVGGSATVHVINATTGAEVNASWGDYQFTLPEGTYYLQFGEGPRTYSFNLYEIPAPQVFAYALNTVVSDGVPWAGAGNVERLGSEDRYTFTVPSGGAALEYDLLAGSATVHVINATTGAEVNASWGDYQFTLPEGTYYLRFGEGPRTYSFNLFLANVGPTAAFTSSVSNLTAAVDGTSSSDSDGSIAGYAWDFGDGSTGTGATASHTYATPGTYTVSLTVTDDDGATGTTTHDVTVVAAPPVNVAPVAGFTSSTSDLTAAVDGATSSDSDGTIAGYAWDFGDGSTGTGATASHTYATSGTYTVSLTVTDDDGATGTITHTVTVAGVVIYAQDNFGRTVTNGFGSADSGGAYTLGGAASNFAVNGGQGRISLPSAGVGRAVTVSPTTVTDVESTIDFTLDKTPTGNGTYMASTLRKVGTSEYRLRVRVRPTSTKLEALKIVSGVETAIGTIETISGNYTAGMVVHIKFRATGSGTTSLKGKAWFDSAAEPSAWQLEATDNDTALQSAGGAGVYLYISGTSTEVPVTASIDNFTLRSAGTL